VLVFGGSWWGKFICEKFYLNSVVSALLQDTGGLMVKLNWMNITENHDAEYYLIGDGLKSGACD
jgi:hypothetical protein